jgi:hypothetical protein
MLQPVAYGKSNSAGLNCGDQGVVCAQRILLFDSHHNQVASFDSDGGAKLQLVLGGNSTTIMPGVMSIRTANAAISGETDFGSSKLDLTQTTQDGNSKVTINAADVIPSVTLSNNIHGNLTSSTLKVDGKIGHP